MAKYERHVLFLLAKSPVFKTSRYYRLLFLAGCTLFFFLYSLLSSAPAYGIRLTNVKHLFDISYKFSQPSDVAVSKDGQIYVVDGVNNTIKVFDNRGNFKFSFGWKGSSKGQFKFPLGIDVGSSGKVYIADSGNHRVQIFDAQGSYISHIDVPSKGEILSDPTDVAVNEAGNRLYVIDNEHHYFLAYDLTTLKLIDTYGSPGAEEREFRYPFLAALDMDSYIYITDVINTRVQVFSPEGKFVNVIGGWGVEKGEFFRPKGVAIDNEKRVFVSDSYMGVIQVFRKNGEFVSALGDPESGRVKKFIKPVGIFIDHNNRLYVVEMFAERVSVYSILGDTE